MFLQNEYITIIDKEILNGAPVFKGTRVAVKTLFDYLEESSLEEFLIGFPSVSRKQAESVLKEAIENEIEDTDDFFDEETLKILDDSME